MSEAVPPVPPPAGCVLRRGCLDPRRCGREMRCCIDDIRDEERDDFELAYAEHKSGRRFGRWSDHSDDDMP